MWMTLSWIESLKYTSVTDSMDLASFDSMLSTLKKSDTVKHEIAYKDSSKAIYFVTKGKSKCDFLLTNNSYGDLILHCFGNMVM